MGRNEHLDGGRFCACADPEAVRAGSSGIGSSDAEVEVHIKRGAIVARAPWMKPLRDAIAGCSDGHVRAHFSTRIEILERALRGVRHRDLSLVNPRRDEHAIAAARRRGLHLEVPIEIIERAQHRRRHGLLLLLQLARERGHARIEFTPLRPGFFQRLQRHHRARFRFLLRAGEGVARAVENAVQRVIIARRDGIEFVIVTACAAQAQAQHGLTQRVDRVLDRQVVIILRVESEAAGDREITGGRRAFRVQLARAASREDVPGDLLAQELVVRFVRVEGIDDVIAIAPRERHRVVRSLARSIRVAHDIEPVASPAFAVMRRGQQAIDDFREGVCRFVGEKSVDFLRRRWKAAEIERRPADQGALVRRRRRLPTCRREAGIHKAIDLGRGWRSRGGRRQRLKRPPGFCFRRVHAADFGDRLARVRRTHAHPFLQHRDLRILQLAALFFRRHGEVLVRIAHGLDDEAFVRLAGHDRRAGVAALGPARLGLQRKPSFGLRAAVAVVAMLDEQRADFRFKKSRVLRSDLRRHLHGRSAEENRDRKAFEMAHGGHVRMAFTTWPETSVRR